MTPVIFAAIAQIPLAFYFKFPANHYIDSQYERPGITSAQGGIWGAFWRISGLVSCYFCGTSLAFAMVMIDEKVNHFVIKKRLYFAIMILSGFILLSLVCWPFEDLKDAPEKRWGPASNSWYSAFYKTAWVKSPCFLCVNLQSESFLSFKVFCTSNTCKKKLTQIAF